MPVTAPHGGATRTGPGRQAAALALALAVAVLLALWLSGAFAAIGHWALGQQRALQALLGQHIQDIRAGRSAAFWALIALSAGYGFLHALGPGHGKVLVTGAALGTRASARRMGAIALAGSLGQALVAIALVYGGFLLFQATARGAVGWEATLEPLGHLAIALIGAWLMSRGLWSLWHPAADCDCGHHAPPAAAEATSLREAAALVGAMAIRPCTGALIVLVLAWRMDLAAAGAAAVLAMGLGTGAFTVLVAVMAVSGREAAFLSAGTGAATRAIAPALQIGAGALIFVVSGALLCAAVLG